MDLERKSLITGGRAEREVDANDEKSFVMIVIDGPRGTNQIQAVHIRSSFW